YLVQGPPDLLPAAAGGRRRGLSRTRRNAVLPAPAGCALMSTARTHAIAFQAVKAALVEVEADLGNGIPGFVILGLPDASLNEARERIKAAARNTGLPIANRKLTVNLSPATLPKFGSGFDLAILVAVLSADRQI